MFLAPLNSGMTIRDLIIIYLACGAPFAVYYFLQNRRTESTGMLWLKTTGRFVFWIPFAIGMVARRSLFTNLYNSGFDRGSNTDAVREAKIEETRRFVDGFASDPELRMSVFELREVFDRYVGLTMELADADSEPSNSESEIFRITNHTSKKAGEACLHRRNLMRLSFHQKLAARDFIKLSGQLAGRGADGGDSVFRLKSLADLLGDDKTGEAITLLAAGNKTVNGASNSTTGDETLWKSAKQNLRKDTTAANLKSLSATMNLSAKD